MHADINNAMDMKILQIINQRSQIGKQEKLLDFELLVIKNVLDLLVRKGFGNIVGQLRLYYRTYIS